MSDRPPASGEPSTGYDPAGYYTDDERAAYDAGYGDGRDRYAAAPPEGLDAAVTLIRRLIVGEDTPCRFDHHGYCQEHRLEKPCSVEDARQYLARLSQQKERDRD